MPCPSPSLAGIAQHASRGLAYGAITALIEFWRSTLGHHPALRLLLHACRRFGLRLSGITVGSMVLGLHIGAYGSQAVRGALQALDKGQAEAGRAIGMRDWQILLLIELPQALLAMVPTFINQFIQLVKGTALVSLVTLTDMTFRAKEICPAPLRPAEDLFRPARRLFPSLLPGDDRRALDRAPGRRRQEARP